MRERETAERGCVSEACAVDLIANGGRTLYEARERDRLVRKDTEGSSRPLIGHASTDGDFGGQGSARCSTFVLDRARASPAH